MTISAQKIDEWFGEKCKPNLPNKDGIEVEEMRLAAKKLARTITQHTPPSADQSAAIRKVRDALHDAYSAMAFGK